MIEPRMHARPAPRQFALLSSEKANDDEARSDCMMRRHGNSGVARSDTLWYSCGVYTYDLTSIRRPFDCLSKVVKRRVGSGVVRIDPLRFLAGCRTRRLNQALSVLSLTLDFLSVL